MDKTFCAVAVRLLMVGLLQAIVIALAASVVQKQRELARNSWSGSDK